MQDFWKCKTIRSGNTYIGKQIHKTTASDSELFGTRRVADQYTCDSNQQLTELIRLKQTLIWKTFEKVARHRDPIIIFTCQNLPPQWVVRKT